MENQTTLDIALSRFDTLRQDQAHQNTSDKYSFISTERVLRVFADHGWMPSKVMQATTRKVENKGFQKHIVRLRNSDIAMPEGHSAEIVLVNSHLGTASFQLLAGVFRCVCLNGLIAGSRWGEEKIRHIGYTDSAVESAISNISKTLPQISDGIENMSKIQLSDAERAIFVKSAIELRQVDTNEDGTPKYAISPDSISRPWRSQDRATDLWTTMNVVQENMIKGGYRMINTQSHDRRRSRAVTSVDENVRLNRGLWTLAEEMKKLKGY